MAVGTVSGITPDNWQLLETVTAPGGTTAVTSSVTLTGYSKLMIVVSATVGSGDNLSIRFNGDTGDNYASTALQSSATATATNRIVSRTVSSTSLQNFNMFVQYANISAPKLADIYSSGGISRGSWFTATAITSITLVSFSGNNIDSGTMKIYGIAG